MKHFLSNWRWRMREFLGVMREMWYFVILLLLLMFTAFAKIMAILLCVSTAQLEKTDSADNNNVAANTATTARVLEHQRSMNMRILFR